MVGIWLPFLRCYFFPFRLLTSLNLMAVTTVTLICKWRGTVRWFMTVPVHPLMGEYGWGDLWVALGDANKTPESGLHRLMATMGLLLQAVRWLGGCFEWWWQNSYKSDWTHATICAILWPWRQQAFFSAFCWELHCRAFPCYPEFSMPVKHRMTQSPFTWKQHFQTLKSEHKCECDQNLVCVHIWSLPEAPRRKKTAWQKLAMLSKYLWGLS